MAQKVQKTTFRRLLASNIQFVIPFFQRGYAWSQEQWKQLFDDIDDEILSELKPNENYTDYEHFFSSIVVMSKSNEDIGLQKFDVIDGQQRITTIYIILSVIQKLLIEKNQQQFEQKYLRYLKNDLEFGEDDDYKKLKIFSTKGDRLSTYKILFSEDPQSPYVQLDNQFITHKSQVEVFADWLLRANKYKLSSKSAEELILLADIILDCLKIVWIPLDKDSNNAQAIFESLNARGTPLDSSELLCNYIFRGFESKSEQDIEKLHNDYWLFSKNKIAKFDDYLMHLYSIGQSKNIGRGRKIYSFFKKSRPIVSEENSLNHLNEIKSMVKFYTLVTNPSIQSRIPHDVIYKLEIIKATSIDSITPFLMELLKEYVEQKITLEETNQILHEVIVMLIRVKIVGHDTKEIGLLFPSLYSSLKSAENKIMILQEKFTDFDYLISDESFQESLIERGLYSTQNIIFTRRILIEIDKAKHNFGQYPDYNTLTTIEHICPQNGRDKTGWTEYLGDDSENIDLHKAIHSIGNLLLLSRPANSSASNNPFKEKIDSYHDLTFLNKDIKARYNANIHWNIDAIKQRSKDLSEIALKLWSWKNN